MKKVAITGGIATGKSTLLKILAELGQTVLSCDEIVHLLYEEEPIKEELVRLLGNEVLDRDGRVNKKAILDKISRSDSLKKRLEEFIHNKVWEFLERRFAELEREGIKAVFVEVPLLFEAGWEKRFDEVWVIACEKETQVKRLVEGGRAHLFPLLERQLPLEEKVKRAHRVFSSEVPLSKLKEEVERALSNL
jgi:dephospho-CoA kinase